MGWKDFASTVFGDLLTFLATVLGHVLSWPVVVLVIVLILLKPLRRLIGRLRTAEGLGSKWQFAIEEIAANTATAAQEVSDSISPPAEDAPDEDAAERPREKPKRVPKPEGDLEGVIMTTAPPPTDRSTELRLIALNGKEPKDAVLAAWAGLRGRLVALHAHLGGEYPSGTSTRKILADLTNSPHVTDAFVDAVNGLFELRTRVMRGTIKPDRPFARGYVGSSLAMEKIADTLLNVDPSAPPTEKPARADQPGTGSE